MRFRRRLRARATLCALVAGIVCTAAPRPGLADDTTSANVVAARKHFEKARSYYGQGAYREAIAELEAAHVLDPSAKDLVFNLGVVHEKLGDIDDALRWFRLFTTMDLTAQERERADAYIKRLEGAKKEVEDKQAAQQKPTGPQRGAPPSRVSTEPTPPPVLPPPERSSGGRVDGLTVAAIGATGLGLAFGIVMAVRAKLDEPAPNFVTGRDGNYADLVNRQDTAHREAVLADIGFGVAVVGAVTAATLYFARPRAPAAPTAGSTQVSAAPLAGGGALLVQGSF
jgi:tetratricopeptide (TPR) repeat protein